jgi:hypothetical protein
MATGLPSRVSVPRYTSPIPPSQPPHHSWCLAQRNICQPLSKLKFGLSNPQCALSNKPFGAIMLTCLGRSNPNLPALPLRVSSKIIRASAAEAIRIIVRNGKILPKHKRELIPTVLWKITEAEGKYRLRFRSAGALTCKQANQLRHEHVFTRKQLTHELLHHPRAIKRILTKCLACVVTKAEHTKLNRVPSAVQGWARYRKAGIKVYDTGLKGFVRG